MRFLHDRLNHRVPLKTLFWRDMVLWGTALNLIFLGIALAMAANGFPAWQALLVFLLPLPYNVFVWHCVWTGAGRLDGFGRSALRSIATGWLVLVIVL